MAETEKTTFWFDLDNKEMLKKILETKSAILELGEAKNLTGLMTGFVEMLPLIGAVGVAVWGMHKAFEATLEAEKIEKVNQQFGMLSEQAGIAGEALRDALEKGAKGLIDDSDLIESANRGLIELGKNAMWMGETMQRAIQIQKVFGGDAKEIFENLNRALATGQTRLLRQYGIVIDNDKALKEYAQTHNRYVSDLTDEEKKTAIAEQALKKMRETYKGISTNTQNLTTMTQQLSVAWKDFKEIIDVFISKVVKPVLMPVFEGLKITLHQISVYLKKDMGEGAEKARNQMTYLTEKIRETRHELMEMEAISKRKPTMGMSGQEVASIMTAQKKVRDLRKEYTSLLKESSKVQEELNKLEKKEKKSSGSDAESSEGKKKTQAKFYEDLLKMKSKNLADQIAMESDYDKMQEMRQEQLGLMMQEAQARIASVDEKYRAEGRFGTAENLKERELVWAEYANNVRKINDDLYNDQIKAAENAAKAQARQTSGFAKGFKAAGLSASKDLGNFAKLGQVAFDSINKHGKNAFLALGDGSKNASQVMTEFMLGAIADMAEAQGEFLLASGIGTFNPVQIAEGGALITLAGFLRGVSGRASGAMGASGGGGGGGGDVGGIESLPETASALQETETKKPQKAVTIQVQGNYFETEQTKRTLMEMIRSETDATSFSYVQINQGGAS